MLLIYSTTSAEMIEHGLDKSSFAVVFKQLSYAVVGVGLAFTIAQKGYLFMMQWSRPLFWMLVLTLVLVLIPGVGKVVNGSRRWLGVGGLTFQPSEFVKIILPLYLIPRLIALDKSSLLHFLRLMVVCSLPIVLILIEPNTGTAGVIALTTLSLLFLTKIPFRFWALPLLTALIVGVGFAANLDYVQRRLQVYLHPESDLKGKGHQPYQAKIAIGRGGLLGQGPGMSRQKLSYLPEAQNDYIAAIYAEEFGFLGVLLLLLLYFIFVLSALGVALQATDPKGTL
ncbi:MAG: FtsW/RodA/SpoVE family cell cycle protein, partial [Chlamydiia bacterium]|nr:FtsW/RodA/SpoVE family cell cycle protein [Chlamydiia bacterium]